MYSKRRNGKDRRRKRKEKRERLGLGEENGKLFLIRAFLQELDEHQVRKAALLLISTKVE